VLTNDEQREGKALFKVGSAFFRPSSRPARDLGVLAAAIYKNTTGRLRVLDVMTGCGVRSQRYALESNADWIWANDANPDMALILEANLRGQLSLDRYQITYQSAYHVSQACYQHQDYYDFIDLDSFGLPCAYLQGCLQAIKWGGLLYITATDSRTLAGHHPNHSLRQLGAYARCHPAAHEQGLRLLMGNCWQQAQPLGLTIQPIFAYFQGQIYRVMVQVIPASVPANLGFVGYCHQCGHYQTVDWRQLSRVLCPHDHRPLTLNGPMWLGPLHHPDWLQKMGQLAEAWDWPNRSRLLQIMADEVLMPPYFFPVAEIGRRGKMDIPRRDRILQDLQHQGYAASLTHIHPQAFKTNAPFQTCLHLATQLSRRQASPQIKTS
jgi:tRNA (guanine26-N2/guanine27-N2)-dimethyltransferase